MHSRQTQCQASLGGNRDFEEDTADNLQSLGGFGFGPGEDMAYHAINEHQDTVDTIDERRDTVDTHPNTPSMYPGGTTFMVEFFNDEHAHLWQDNLYYPFASWKDWQLASWLLRSRLSMTAIDDFLSLDLVCLASSCLVFQANDT